MIVVAAAMVLAILVVRVSGDGTKRRAPETVAEAIGIPGDIRALLSSVDGHP